MSLAVDSPTESVLISLTQRAADELRALMAAENKADSALRVWVAGGGCSGMQYGMALDDGEPAADDKVLDHLGVKIYVDDMSLQYMQGAVVDYVDDQMGPGFKIENPNATSSCGCGSSFSTEDSTEDGPAPTGGCGSCGHNSN